MKVSPILFSAPMVRAILREIEQPGAGKTQTRRAIDMPPMTFDAVFHEDGVWYVGDAATGHYYAKLPVRHRVGDRLYVREAWRVSEGYDPYAPRSLNKGMRRLRYEADGWQYPRTGIWEAGKLRPAMFMPRWASRITLIVTDVRVHRLQEISEEDAIAEGVERLHQGFYPYGITTFMTTVVDGREVPAQCCTTACGSFRMLWDSINGDRPGLAWKYNPWVAAYTFEPHLINIDAYLERSAP